MAFLVVPEAWVGAVLGDLLNLRPIMLLVRIDATMAIATRIGPDTILRVSAPTDRGVRPTTYGEAENSGHYHPGCRLEFAPGWWGNHGPARINQRPQPNPIFSSQPLLPSLPLLKPLLLSCLACSEPSLRFPASSPPALKSGRVFSQATRHL